MKKIILPILVMILLPGVILAKNLTAGYEPAGLDELAKQKGTFKTTLINPEADFPRYTEFRLRKPTIKDVKRMSELTSARDLFNNKIVRVISAGMIINVCNWIGIAMALPYFIRAGV